MAFDGEIERTGSIVTAIAISLLLVGSAHAANPRIVVASSPENEPKAEEVIEVLREHLLEMEIDVEALEMGATPKTNSKWLHEAKRAAKSEPGTILLIGYSCGETSCDLISADPGSKSVLVVPVEVPDHGELTTAFALAATAREVFLGPLIPELERIAKHGQNPGPPPPSPDSIWLKPPLEDARKTQETEKRPWLWLEIGYGGDHPHPEGKPNHGGWIGVDIEPRKPIGLSLSVGWLGIRERSGEYWDAKFHRVASSLALRLLFALGPAHVSIAPVVRFDMLFSEIDNEILGTRDHDLDLEIHTGGITTWHLPLSKRLEVVVGAGLLFTVLSEKYEVDVVGDLEEVMPASELRIIWSAGLAWSPL